MAPVTVYVTYDELQPVVDLAAYYELSGPQEFPYRIPGSHFLLVTEGRIYARTPTGATEAKAGDVLCFPSADTNLYGFHGPVHYYEAHIQLAPPPRHRHVLWVDGAGPLPLSLPCQTQLGELRRVFDTICLHLAQPGPAARAHVTAAVWEMLAILAGVVRPNSRTGTRIDPWQRARQRLATDEGARLSIQGLAAELELSVDHFIRGFRRRFGISPGQFRSRERLRLAAHRLRAGDEPIKAIARACGFADTYAFSRAFRRYLGVLPSDVRANRVLVPPSGPTGETGEVGSEPLMPVNRHIVPPDIGPDFYGRFQPRSERAP